jgi:formate dehydrogenase iron-sulfur subunit
LQPACAEACPAGATIFGEREELVRIAHERLAENPDDYVPRIYGLEEVGGTSVLYLSSVPFEDLGFKTNLQRSSMPVLTWNVLSKIPSIVTVGGVFLYGIYWITNRRDYVRTMEEQEQSEDGQRPGGVS